MKAAARLCRPVEVVSGRNPQFHRRVAIEVADERTPARQRQRQWTVRSVKIAGATLVILEADEIRQYIGSRPADAALFAPIVVILGLPANGEKSVDQASLVARRLGQRGRSRFRVRRRHSASVSPVETTEESVRSGLDATDGPLRL